MTDKDRLYTAKLYIDKLANGMNPMTGEDLPEDAILNDVSLCRSFVFISGVLADLQKGADRNGGLPYAMRKEKFRINDSQKREILISDECIGISTVASRIGKVLDRNVKNIPAVRITSWLESQGFLERETFNDKVYKKATRDGELIGIETRNCQYGDKEYLKTYYNGNAQAFIIANLESIAEYGG